ncbi:P-type conjugative transfer protein TrbG [Acetobacteraceae bacterium]|nr:P-type conjugative transfer protein TrbG [Acetobacteraceae bacterium]
MKKLLLSSALSSLFLLTGSAFAQEQAAPPPPPLASTIPANPPEDNVPPSPAEEQAYMAKVEAVKAEIYRKRAEEEAKQKTVLPEPPADPVPAPQPTIAPLPPAPAPKNEPSKKLSVTDNNKSANTSSNAETTADDNHPTPENQNTPKSKEKDLTPDELKVKLQQTEEQLTRQDKILLKQNDVIQKLGQVIQGKIAYPSTQESDHKFFSPADNPLLNEDELTALKNQKSWNTRNSVKPTSGKNGATEFVFGTQMPSILAAVLQVTDVQFQEGEKILNVNVGDATRWKLDPASTGTGETATQHLIIKPLENGLQSSLVVATDRRIYHLHLKSDLMHYYPYVTFSYPEEAQAILQAKLEKEKAAEIKEKTENTLPETGEYLGNLNFHYCIKGKKYHWTPERVYNDGHKTIIQLSDAIQETEIPILLVSSPFSKTPGLVNSRFQNHKFIVDQLFDKAQLMMGVGKRQQKITIKKGVC